MCLAQGHNTVMPVRLDPVAPRSPVKYSSTEPLHSHLLFLKYTQKNVTPLPILMVSTPKTMCPSPLVSGYNIVDLDHLAHINIEIQQKQTRRANKIYLFCLAIYVTVQGP